MHTKDERDTKRKGRVAVSQKLLKAIDNVHNAVTHNESYEVLQNRALELIFYSRSFKQITDELLDDYIADELTLIADKARQIS